MGKSSINLCDFPCSYKIDIRKTDIQAMFVGEFTGTKVMVDIAGYYNGTFTEKDYLVGTSPWKIRECKR